jgi:MSHA biogenesis protein MshQ
MKVNMACPESMRSKRMRFLSFLVLVTLVSVLTKVSEVQAAPAFQAAGTAANGTGAVSPAWPAHAIDDIALLFVESAGGEPATLSTAAGFVAVANSPQATGAGTAGTRITVFWARATSTSMATPTVADPGNHVYAQIITYRGVINTGNPWDITGGGVKAAASTSVTVTGVTTTVANDIIVQVVARNLSSAAAAFSAEANPDLVGITERSDAGTTAGVGGGFAVWDGTHAVPSALANTTATVTSSINAFLTIALKPPPQAAPTCSPPSNIPVGVTVTCQCDNFGRATLNPSTIFGANWLVSNSDVPAPGTNPYINLGTGLLRLTENSGNNAKAATVPGVFPAAGNYISVEFQQYAYTGTGADGMAVTLSDYSVPAVPGAYGGSLGYAQKTGINGFTGGWIGVALDEYGNYENSSEGRIGGTCAPQGCATLYPQSVGVRGSGSGTTGYNWLTGNTAAGTIDNTGSQVPSRGYYYQVIVDARNDPASTSVTVNRDTTGTGTSYTSLINIPNIYTAATAQSFTQSPVPTNWQISFTGSTGGSTNIHEIGGVRVCAQSNFPPTGGTASGFSAIDEAYPAAPTVPAYQNFQTGHIYMKLMGTSFKLWVAALTNIGISTGYSFASAKYVQVRLVDNSDNACGPDTARTCNAAACTSKSAVEAGATQIATFISGSNTGVASPSPTFTLNSAWKNLIAVMKECSNPGCSLFTATAPACSADSFTVRPTSFTSVTSTNAAYGGTTSSSPTVAAGNPFSLTATAAGIGVNPGGYTGVPKINSASVQAVSPATVTGALAGTFSAATSGAGNSTATGSAFTYSEVGIFRLRAPDFTVPRIPGVYDDNWTAIDSDPTKNDCISGTTSAAYSNTIASGKYGCNFGITADTNTSGNPAFGRFTPAYFDVTPTQHGCTGSTFTYSGQPFRVTVTPYNSSGANTLNYTGALGFAQAVTISDPNGVTNCPSNNCFANNAIAASAFVNVGGIVSGSTNPIAGPGLPITYTFTAKETPPLAPLILRATDTDSVSSQNHIEGSTTIRSGRLYLQNAFGSELLALPMHLLAQYYVDANTGWVTHNADTCTSLSTANLDLSNNIQDPPLGTPTITINSGPPAHDTTATIANTPLLVSGDAGLSFSAPSFTSSTQVRSGYTDVRIDLSSYAWLRYDWTGSGTPTDPNGRATFGIYRGSPRSIYLRERY